MAVNIGAWCEEFVLRYARRRHIYAIYTFNPNRFRMDVLNQVAWSYQNLGLTGGVSIRQVIYLMGLPEDLYHHRAHKALNWLCHRGYCEKTYQKNVFGDRLYVYTSTELGRKVNKMLEIEDCMISEEKVG